MALTTHVQTNFSAGELTPRLFGRTDVSKYQNGCEKLENFIVFPHGGIIRRSGTRFVAEVKDSSRFTRLIPFKFSNEQSYVIEFGHNYVRFYRDRGKLLDGLGAHLEFVAPYQEAHLRGIYYTQSADILYLCHSLIRPQELQRLSDVSWQFVNFAFNDGPYLDVNTTTTTMTPSGTTGAITITASAVTGINGGQGFLATDVGRLIRIKVVANWGYAEITAITSTLVVSATVRKNLDGIVTTDDWRLGAWSDTTGWPRVATFHQERLWFGGTTTQPQTLWGSVTADFTNFQPTQADGTVVDDDAVIFTVADERVNSIRWMVSALKGMVVGTSDGEFVVQSRGAFDPITPTTIAAARQTPYGSRINVRAVASGPAVLFVQGDGRRVREFAFNFNLDQFASPDMTLLAEHITTSAIVDMAYQLSPEQTIWAALDDGTLLSFTYLREQEVVAWSRHPLGGSGLAQSIAIIPDDPADLVWLIVQRTINGATKRYVEFIEDFFPIGGDKADAFYVDSGLSYVGAPATVISGLSHLEGKSVAVLADGAGHPNKTVTGGSITLDAAASTVQVGLGFSSTVKTLPLFPERAPYDPRGKLKAVYKAFIDFHQTIGGRFGIIETDTDRLVFRTPTVPMGQGPPLFTGVHEVVYPTGHDRRVQMVYLQDQPLPSTLLSIIFEMDLGGV